MEDLKSQLKFLREVETKEIFEEARAQAAKIIADAQAKAELVKNKETQEVMEKVRNAEQLEMESARLQGKRRIINARLELVEKALEKALDRLKKLAESQDQSYKDSLERLIAEAIEAMTGNEFEVAVNPRDAPFVKQRLKHLEKTISSARKSEVTLNMDDEPLQNVGGGVVQSKDGRQVFNNTLEARLAKIRLDALPKIGEILFEGAKA